MIVCRLHWINFVIPGVFCFVFLLYGVKSLFSGVFSDFFLSAVATAILAGYILVEYKTTYIAMTETKIVGHRGFIRSKTMSTPLSKIQNISVSNGFLGKIFKYHTIIIDNAGSDKSEFPFPRMAKTKKFVDAVQEKI